MQILSLSSQGLWTRMLCWMHFNQNNRGYLELPTGEPMNTEDVAAKCGKPLADVEQLITEMRRHGVFSTDERGCIWNRRMVKDTDITRKRTEAAKKRAEEAERTGSGTFAPAKHPAKSGPIGDLVDGVVGGYRLHGNQQNTVLSDSVSSSSSDSPKGSSVLSDNSTLVTYVRTESSDELDQDTQSLTLTAPEPPEEKAARRTRFLDESHDRFYGGYWRRVKKPKSRAAWPKAIVKVAQKNSISAIEAAEFLIARMQTQKQQIETRTDLEWLEKTHPSSWLNAESWEDDLSAPKTKAAAASARTNLWSTA